MLIRWPIMFTKTILLVLVLLIGNRVGAFQSSLGTTATVITSVLLGDVLELGLIAQRRRKVSQFIQDHATEIQTMV